MQFIVFVEMFVCQSFFLFFALHTDGTLQSCRLKVSSSHTCMRWTQMHTHNSGAGVLNWYCVSVFTESFHFDIVQRYIRTVLQELLNNIPKSPFDSHPPSLSIPFCLLPLHPSIHSHLLWALSSLSYILMAAVWSDWSKKKKHSNVSTCVE